MKNLRYLLLGTLFGIILCKVQAVSWWRMQEMFRLDAFYLFALFATAIPTGMISVWLIRKLQVKTLDGQPVVVPTKKFNWGYVFGGILFGIGWAFSGACPGPLLALIGAGNTVVIVIFLSALLGTWIYSWLKPWLPH